MRRHQIKVHSPRYETPRAAVAVAVFNRQNRVLLVQRADNNMWALPGGWADVGLTPTENAIQEVYQETGLRIECRALIGVYDARFYQVGLTSTPTYTLLFQGEIVDGKLSLHRQEILTANFFAEDSLPELQAGSAQQVADAIRFRLQPQLARFD